MFNKGFVLYLWLVLFTIFVSIFSLILFEYVGSDIKIVRKIYMERRKYFDYRSIIMAVAEIYKETERKIGRYETNLGSIRYNVEYEIKSLSSSDIIVDLKRRGQLIARSMVRIRERFDKLSLITEMNEINLRTSNYYSSGWLLGRRVNIRQDADVKKKPFSLVMIREDTIVNGKGSNNMENVRELEKYADFVSYGDNRHVLMSYYNQLYNELYNQTRDYRGMERFYNVSGLPANHPHNFIRLTPSGILFIGRTNLYKTIALQFYNPFYMVNPHLQNIRIIGVGNDNRLVDLGEFNFYSDVAKTVSYGTILISNDPNIMNRNGYFESNANYLFSSSNYYKYLTCYGTPNVDTIMRYNKSNIPVMSIISEMPIDIIGYYDDSKRVGQGPRIFWKILILTKNLVTIHDDIFYHGTNQNDDDYDPNIVNYSNPYPELKIIAKEILLDYDYPDIYRSLGTRVNAVSPDFFLMGNFISFFDNNSKIDIIHSDDNVPSLYFFGSVQAVNLNTLNRNIKQEYIVDNRQISKDYNVLIKPSIIDKEIYLDTLVPYFIEVYK